MKIGASFDTGSSNALLDAFGAINKAMRTKVVRRAVNLSTRPLLAKAKEKLKEDGIGVTGQLRKSMGRKVKTYPSGVVVGMVGPRVGFKVLIKTTPEGKQVFHDPARIGHLVEQGHGGPAPAPPHPFMRPAFDESRGEVARIMQSEVTSGLEKEAIKAAGKIGG